MISNIIPMDFNSLFRQLHLSVSVYSLFSKCETLCFKCLEKKIYLEENINALVKMSENKYRVMKMKQRKNIDKEKTEYFRDWNYADINCYGLYHSNSNFPAAEEVLKHPEIMWAKMLCRRYFCLINSAWISLI